MKAREEGLQGKEWHPDEIQFTARIPGRELLWIPWRISVRKSETLDIAPLYATVTDWSLQIEHRALFSVLLSSARDAEPLIDAQHQSTQKLLRGPTGSALFFSFSSAWGVMALVYHFLGRQCLGVCPPLL